MNDDALTTLLANFLQKALIEQDTGPVEDINLDLTLHAGSLEDCAIAPSATDDIIKFKIDAARRKNLLTEVDEIAQSLAFEKKLRLLEATDESAEDALSKL